MTPTALAALHAKAFQTTRAWSAQEFTTLLNHADTFVCGTSDSFIMIRTVLDEAEILTLATDPQKHRQGLARAVLRNGETQAAQMGAAYIFLEVAEDNDAALALYTASGYVNIGRRPNYYVSKAGASIAATIMRKAL